MLVGEPRVGKNHQNSLNSPRCAANDNCLTATGSMSSSTHGLTLHATGVTEVPSKEKQALLGEPQGERRSGRHIDRGDQGVQASPSST